METKAQLIWRENKQGLCDLLEGWDGEGDGREAWKGGDMGITIPDTWCMTGSPKTLWSSYPSIKTIKWKKKKGVS